MCIRDSTDTAFETDGDTNDAIITVEYSDAPAVGELTVEKKGEVLDGFKGGLLASSYAVSYTHLDVYKRQVYERLGNGKCVL